MAWACWAFCSWPAERGAAAAGVSLVCSVASSSSEPSLYRAERSVGDLQVQLVHFFDKNQQSKLKGREMETLFCPITWNCHCLITFLSESNKKRLHVKGCVGILQEMMLLAISILEQCFRLFLFCSPVTASVRFHLCLWSSHTALALLTLSLTSWSIFSSSLAWAQRTSNSYSWSQIRGKIILKTSHLHRLK